MGYPLPNVVLVRFKDGIVLGIFEGMSAALKGIKDRHDFCDMWLENLREEYRDHYLITGKWQSKQDAEKIYEQEFILTMHEVKS